MGTGIVVQKYGGSSVSDAERIKRVAERIVATRKAGHDVCVVVSAMGDTTDELLDLAQQVSPLPPGRELDMLLTAGERMSAALLAMAINDLGSTARSFTGSQAGVITTGTHGDARIIDITPGRIVSALADGDVVIVAGFQGVSQTTKDVTTLGRGASDTTAVALAAALDAAEQAWLATGCEPGVASVLLLRAAHERRAGRPDAAVAVATGGLARVNAGGRRAGGVRGRGRRLPVVCAAAPGLRADGARDDRAPRPG